MTESQLCILKTFAPHIRDGVVAEPVPIAEVIAGSGLPAVAARAAMEELVAQGVLICHRPTAWNTAGYCTLMGEGLRIAREIAEGLAP